MNNLNGSNSSTASQTQTNTSNLVGTNSVMASLSSLTKSSTASPIVSHNSSLKYDQDDLNGNLAVNYALNHQQSTHNSQLNHQSQTQSHHLQDDHNNGTSHLIANNSVDSLTGNQHLAVQNAYHMNQLSTSTNSTSFHPLNTNVYPNNRTHLSSNGFLANTLTTFNNNYNQFNHCSTNPLSSSGYEMPWQLNYEMGYTNGYNGFCPS